MTFYYVYNYFKKCFAFMLFCQLKVICYRFDIGEVADF